MERGCAADAGGVVRVPGAVFMGGMGGAVPCGVAGCLLAATPAAISDMVPAAKRWPPAVGKRA